MKVIALASTKGGTGKTTLCCHLAVEAARQGKTVAIADLDPQSSSTSFADDRGDTEPTIVSIAPARLPQFLEKAKKNGAELVFLDTAPNADTGVAAAQVADMILIPCRPGILDLRAISTTARIVWLSKTPAMVVLNAVPHRAPLIVADAIEAVKKHHLDVAPVVIHQRAVFGKAMIFGKTAVEFEPGSTAANEVTALYDWLDRQINNLV